MGAWRLRSSLSISVFLHALFALLCALLISHQPAHVKPRPWTWVVVDPPRKAAPAQERRQDQLRKQIVQTLEGQKAQQAAKDAFLGERTQVVDRQTVSSERQTRIGKARSTAQPRSESETRQAAAPKPASKAGALTTFGLPILPSAEQLRQEQEKRRDERQWASQGASPQDFVKGIRQSDQTALNTKEYVFFGYFQRIRERLDRAWIPILRSRIGKLYRAGRHLASEMEHTTRVLVTLNSVGEITRVRVVAESGTRDLDDAAVNAFNAAGPFPNPPKGIVDKNGEIEIPWEFILRT
jgi:TonB family protein